MTRTLNGYIARETEKAIGFVAADANRVDAKPLWIPRKKIADMIELDIASVAIQLAGESVQRQSVPVTLTVDAAFLDRIGA
jgi:hypothetical protein